MTAFNAVRFKVKPGREQDFLDAHRRVKADWAGMKSAKIIKTGDSTFCIIGEWESMDAMAAARPQMIATIEYRLNARTHRVCVGTTCGSLAKLEFVLQVLAPMPGHRVDDHQIPTHNACFAAGVTGSRDDDVARRHEFTNLIGVPHRVQVGNTTSNCAQTNFQRSVGPGNCDDVHSELGEAASARLQGSNTPPSCHQ